MDIDLEEPSAPSTDKTLPQAQQDRAIIASPTSGAEGKETVS
jgi:hypothetical protein